MNHHLPVKSITGGRRNSGGRRRLSNKVPEDVIRALLEEETEDPEVEKEELRMKKQLKLEKSLHIETAQRLGVYDTCPSLWVSKKTAAESDYFDESDYADESDIDESDYSVESDSEDDYVTTPITPKNKLQLTRNKLRLYNVTIHPCIVRGRQGKTVTGTLEAHANGFRYKNYSIPFELDIMFHNVSHAFFQDGDKKIAPLFHLHLRNPIMVGTDMTKDIQFRMVQNRNMRRIVRDSDEFSKDGQQRKDNSKIIREFLARFDSICFRSSLLDIEEVKKKHGFYGELVQFTLKDHLTLPATFIFTFTCIVQLQHVPFTVVILNEIEIVNLVHLGSGMELFNMTIVFKDFKRDVIQIKSVPSTNLINIKDWLGIADIKYYESNNSENELDIPLWRSLLQYITENPKTFIENGGWKFLNSGNFINLLKLFQQDPSGITCDSDIEPDQVSDLWKKNKPLTVTTRTMPVGKRVMVSSDESECDLVPDVKEQEIKHTVRRKLVKNARRRMVMSDQSDGEE